MPFKFKDRTTHVDPANEKLNLTVVIFFSVAGLASLIWAFWCH